MPKNSLKTAIFVLICGFLIKNAKGQQEALSLSEAIAIAHENNKSLEASALQIDKSDAEIGTSFDINKTEIFYGYDENNIAANNLPLNVWGINQQIRFPTVYMAQKKVNKGKYQLSKYRYNLDERKLDKNVSLAFIEVLYWKNVKRQHHLLDSLFVIFLKAAEARFSQGDITYLEKLSAEARRNEIGLNLQQSEEEVAKAENNLNRYLQTDEVYKFDPSNFQKLEVKIQDTSNHPGKDFYDQSLDLSRRIRNYNKHSWLPDLRFSYFEGNNNGMNNRSYSGFEAGLAIPLWFTSNSAQVKAANVGMKAVASEREDYLIGLQAHYAALGKDLQKHSATLDYFEKTGKKQAEQLIVHSTSAFDQGEIDYLQYVQLVEQAKKIQLKYLESLLEYNRVVLEMNYLLE